MIKNILNQFDLPDVESVTGMDATFLYAETPTSPMHVGGLVIIEGDLKYETFKEIIRSRIHHIPKLRKRLMSIPMSVDYPYWVDDPDFDLDLHLHHVALPKPGGWKELRKMTSKRFSQPLDRSRPLWEFTFVEGLDTLRLVKPGAIAVISKIHHVAIDGMAGAGILGILFDMTPDTKKIPEPKPWKPQPLPNLAALIAKSSASFAKTPLKFPKIIKDTLTATLKTGFLTRAQHLDLPTAPFSAPHTPLNGIISAKRRWNTTLLELDRVKKLKNVMGTTVNDVLLAICAGALRRYLEEKGKLPRKPLVAMVPVSTRKQEDKKDGNRLSAMLVQLATDIEDPIERLEAIHENAVRGKTYQGAMGAETLADLASAVPFGFANQAAQLYSRYNLAKLHNPVFNVVITNVPGPPMPIYLHGHKLHSIAGMAPIIDGMGLIITILSYDGKITISPTSDAKSMPDINTFSEYILESANELEKLVLKYEKEKGKKKVRKKAPKKAESDKFFLHIKKYLKENPKFIKKPAGIYQFYVKGPAPADWVVNLDRQPPMIKRGRQKTFDMSLTIQDKHLMKIATGKLDIATAFIQGRISVTGDKAKAMKLGSILNKLPKYEG